MMSERRWEAHPAEVARLRAENIHLTEELLKGRGDIERKRQEVELAKLEAELAEARKKKALCEAESGKSNEESKEVSEAMERDDFALNSHLSSQPGQQQGQAGSGQSQPADATQVAQNPESGTAGGAEDEVQTGGGGNPNSPSYSPVLSSPQAGPSRPPSENGGEKSDATTGHPASPKRSTDDQKSDKPSGKRKADEQDAPQDEAARMAADEAAHLNDMRTAIANSRTTAEAEAAARQVRARIEQSLQSTEGTTGSQQGPGSAAAASSQSSQSAAGSASSDGSEEVQPRYIMPDELVILLKGRDIAAPQWPTDWTWSQWAEWPAFFIQSDPRGEYVVWLWLLWCWLRNSDFDSWAINIPRVTSSDGEVLMIKETRHLNRGTAEGTTWVGWAMNLRGLNFHTRLMARAWKEMWMIFFIGRTYLKMSWRNITDILYHMQVSLHNIRNFQKQTSGKERFPAIIFHKFKWPPEDDKDDASA